MTLVTVAWLDAPALFARHIQVDGSGQIRAIDYPSGWESVALHAALLPFLALSIAFVLRQLLAFHGSTGARRQQLKAMLSGGAIAIAGLLISLLAGSLSGQFWYVVSNGAFLAVNALPIGIGVGILRYRLYDIDRLVSRTLSYAILTALLVGIYVGVVTLATRALPFSSPIGVAASTLAAAALFNPLRTRIQHVVDRRFNRARYDAEAIVATFTAHLRDAIDLETVQMRLGEAVDRTVEPGLVSLWIRPPVTPPRP